MGNRILRDSILISPDIDALSWRSEAMFYRLLTVCDDYGRSNAEPRLLRAYLCQLRTHDLTVQDITEFLEQLEELGLISTYEVAGRPYLAVTNFREHQRGNQRHPKTDFPDPNDTDADPAEGDASENPGKFRRNRETPGKLRRHRERMGQRRRKREGHGAHQTNREDPALVGGGAVPGLVISPWQARKASLH